MCTTALFRGIYALPDRGLEVLERRRLKVHEVSVKGVCIELVGRALGEQSLSGTAVN